MLNSYKILLLIIIYLANYSKLIFGFLSVCELRGAIFSRKSLGLYKIVRLVYARAFITRLMGHYLIQYIILILHLCALILRYTLLIVGQPPCVSVCIIYRVCFQLFVSVCHLTCLIYHHHFDYILKFFRELALSFLQTQQFPIYILSRQETLNSFGHTQLVSLSPFIL